MQKIKVKLISVLLCVVLIIGLVPIVVLAENIAEPEAAAELLLQSTRTSTLTLHPGGIQAEDALSVGPDGLLYNKKGEEVVLVGTNFGGWMLQESWMCPVIGNDRAWANLNTIRAMEGRGWTAEQIQLLFDTYQDNYITEDDFDYVAAMGMNTVRIPFWYRNFMSDEEGTYINDCNGRQAFTTNPGFARLDWAVEQAQKRGMYVILDLHGAVGGQSMNHSTGTLERNTVFTNDVHRAATIDLWESLAIRYKDHPAVAVYDALNEPQNNGDTPLNQFPMSQYNNPQPGTPLAISQTNSLYNDLYHAIRAVDSDTIFCVEAIWTMDSLPDNEITRQWTHNVMYSMHLYDNNKGNPLVSSGTIDFRTQEMLKVRAERGVAVYVGEFNNDNGQAGSNNQFYAYHLWNENHVSWTTWTYKVTGWNRGNWGLVHNPSQSLNANPTATSFTIVDGSNRYTAPSHSFEQMLVMWGPVLRTFQPGTQTLNTGFSFQSAQRDFTRFGLASAPPKAKPAVMFNEFEELDGVVALSNTTVRIVESDNPESINEKAVQFTITGTAADPNNSRRAIRISPTEGGSFNAAGYGWLIMNIKDTQGANRVWVGFNGTNGGWHSIGNAASTTANWNGQHGGQPLLTVRNEWTRIAVPMSAAGARFSNIQNVIVGFNNAGTYLIDSIYFADDPTAAPPRAGMPTLEGRPEISLASGVFPVGFLNVELDYAYLGAEIRYTLDGSVPNESSLLYDGSVTINIIPGRETVLRARAFIDDEFSRVAAATFTAPPESPLFTAYPVGANNAQNNPPAGWTRYEAENPNVAVIIGSTRTGDNPPGTEAQSFYSGGRAAGGLDFKTPLEQLAPDWSNLSHVRFTVEVEQTGRYLIRLRYNGNDNKNIIVAANGSAYEIISLPNQSGGGWNTAYIRQFMLPLVAGTNEIWVSAPFDANWANIDCIDIQNVPFDTVVGLQYTDFAAVSAQFISQSGSWPVPEIIFAGETLVFGRDFLVEYRANNIVGTATVTAFGIGNFTGSIVIPFEIVEPQLVEVVNPRFVSMLETAYNSKVWLLTFEVTRVYDNGERLVVRYTIALPGNNANQQGVYVFGLNTNEASDYCSDLEGLSLVYDIKGNGSNIKDFRLR